MSNSSANLERALSLHRQGRLAEAGAGYREVLDREPRNADALHLLGLVVAAMGNRQEAVRLIGAAVELQPSNASMQANLGSALCELGRPAEAISRFDRALVLQGDLAAAYLGRGTALAQMDQIDQALANLGQAVRLAPQDTRAYNALGVVLDRAKRPQEALRIFQQALALDPTNAEAHHNLGLVYVGLGQHADALASIERALALMPQHAILHTNRGTQLLMLQRPTEALASFDRAVAIQPGDSIAHHNRGLALMSVGRHEEALAALDYAIVLSPVSAQSHLWRVKALVALGRADEALASLDRMKMLAPAEFETHFQRGVALAALHRYEESAASFGEALKADPASPEAFNNRGAVLVRLFRPAEALDDFQQAIARRPNYVDAHVNAGNALKGLARYHEALQAFDRALALKPTDPTSVWSKAVLKLALGDFQAGWPLYEARLLREDASVRRQFAAPRWSGGEPLKGKTIFIHSEQGLGDTLQFCRYLSLLNAAGADVVFEVQSPLAKIMQSLSAPCSLIARGDPLPPFDFHSPLLSLPLAFGTRMETIPGGVPYLNVQTAARQSWAQTLAGQAGKKIGLNWHGNPEAEKLSALQARSFPLSAAAALAQVPGVCFVSLQKGAGAEQLGQSDFGRAVAQLTDPERMGADEIAEETAAIIMGLDLVITADTALAHLAGALGAPVWLVLQAVPDWRWLIDRKDNPWYPTMRLFRQSKPGDWNEVFDRVAAELSTWTAPRR